MTSRGSFRPLRPELDRFLFATVGDEFDGMPLSVISALTRLGLDPWQEAGRLSSLSNREAVEQLARLIVELPGRRCQINVYRAEAASGGTRNHAAVTAFLHWFAASARKIRSVERGTRWRWRLKALWTTACMLRNRWAERADLNRCILRSRRRTT